MVRLCPRQVCSFFSIHKLHMYKQLAPRVHKIQWDFTHTR